VINFYKKIGALTLSIFLFSFSLYFMGFSDKVVWSYNQNNLHRILIVWQEENVLEKYEHKEIPSHIPIIKIYP